MSIVEWSWSILKEDWSRFASTCSRCARVFFFFFAAASACNNGAVHYDCFIAVKVTVSVCFHFNRIQTSRFCWFNWVYTLNQHSKWWMKECGGGLRFMVAINLVTVWEEVMQLNRICIELSNSLQFSIGL